MLIEQLLVALGYLELLALLRCHTGFAKALQVVEVFQKGVDWQELGLACVLLLDPLLTFFQLTFAFSHAFVLELKVDAHLLPIESLHLLAALLCVWQEKACEL